MILLAIVILVTIIYCRNYSKARQCVKFCTRSSSTRKVNDSVKYSRVRDFKNTYKYQNTDLHIAWDFVLIFFCFCSLALFCSIDCFRLFNCRTNCEHARIAVRLEWPFHIVYHNSIFLNFFIFMQKRISIIVFNFSFFSFGFVLHLVCTYWSIRKVVVVCTLLSKKK